MLEIVPSEVRAARRHAGALCPTAIRERPMMPFGKLKDGNWPACLAAALALPRWPPPSEERHISFARVDGVTTRGLSAASCRWQARAGGGRAARLRRPLQQNGDMGSRHDDWAERFAAAGYVVLFPDSFGPRGVDSICNTRERRIVPRERGADAAAAADWLAAQPFVDKDADCAAGLVERRLVGAVGRRRRPQARSGRVARGDRLLSGLPCARREHQVDAALQAVCADRQRRQLDSPEPCRKLAERDAVRLIEYPGAVHGFDAPNSPRRTRTGAAYSAAGDGNVEVGTDRKGADGCHQGSDDHPGRGASLTDLLSLCFRSEAPFIPSPHAHYQAWGEGRRVRGRILLDVLC